MATTIHEIRAGLADEIAKQEAHLDRLKAALTALGPAVEARRRVNGRKPKRARRGAHKIKSNGTAPKRGWLQSAIGEAVAGNPAITAGEFMAIHPQYALNSGSVGAALTKARRSL